MYFAGTYKIIIEILMCFCDIVLLLFRMYHEILMCSSKTLASFVSIPQVISANNRTYNDVKVTAKRWGRPIAQAVSRRLPTAAVRVQTRVGKWDFVMDKSGAGVGFLRELRFPLPIYIPSCSP
jgi:hypothetical protein